MTEPDQVQDEPVEAVESPVNITIPEPEPANDNAGDEGGAAEPTGPQRQTRQERKEMRFRHLTEARTRADDAERRLASEAEERRKMSVELAELRGRQQAYEQTRRQEAGDPVQKRIADAHAQAYKKLQAAANSQDPARSEEAMREYHETLTSAAEVAAERRMQAQLDRFRQSMPDPNQQRTWGVLTTEFDWLESNPAARAMADGYIGYLMQAKGRPGGIQTYREACAMAAKEFGLGGTVERPSESRRSAYNGVPARASAQSSDEGRNQLQVSGEDATKMRRMAAKLYPEMDQEAAYKKWLGTVGPKLMRK